MSTTRAPFANSAEDFGLPLQSPSWRNRPALRYGALAALDLGSKALAFLTATHIAQHFGGAAFGQINLAQSLLSFGLIIATCGMDTLAVRQVAARLAEPRILAGTVLVWRAVLGLITACGLIAACCLVPQFRPITDLTAIFSLTLITGAASTTWLAQATGRTGVVGCALFATQLVYLAAVQWVIHRGGTVAGVTWGMVVAEFATACGVLLWSIRNMGRPQFSNSWRSNLRFLQEAAPIGAANLLRMGAIASDVLLLGLLLDLTVVGQYSAAFKVFSLGASLTAVYFVILHPRLAAAAATGKDALRHELQQSLRATVPVAVFVMAGALLVAAPTLRVLFGAEFEGSSGALRILLLTLPVYLISGHHRGVLLAMNRQRQDLRHVALGTATHVGAKLILIPWFGMEGCAWGTLLGEVVLMLLSRRAAGA